jgi:2-polyprenyl-3-methyl-5-hydroxy-6-metoxy-1,4-benzoquinol methylase
MDTSHEHESYYQEEFAGDSPQVLLPEDNELRLLVKTNFSGSPLDISNKIQVLQTLRPKSRVLDFGCSWGYGTYQLIEHGFDAVGFEISKPRVVFGRTKLGLTLIESFDDLAKLPDESFDIIFSNHVVEHLPDLNRTFAILTRLLKQKGFVFHILPNFTGKKALSGYWVKWIGEDHPIAPAIPFFEIAIPRAGLTKPIFGSSPFDSHLAQILNKKSSANLSTEGDELLVYAHKN